MPRIPIAAIPNAPQGAAMPTGEAAGRGVNFSQAAGMMRQEGIAQGAFDGAARGMKSLATGVQQTGGVLDRIASQKAQADNDAAIIGAQAGLNDHFAAYQSQITPGSDPNEIVPLWQKSLDVKTKAILGDKSLSNDAKAAIQRYAVSFGSEKTNSLTMFAASKSFERSAKAHTQLYETQIDAGDADGAAGTVDAMLKKGLLWDTQADGMKQHAKKLVQFNQAQADIEADPVAASQALQDPAKYAELPQIQRVRLQERATAKTNALRSDKFGETIDLIDGGRITTMDDAKEFFGPSMDAAAEQKLSNYFAKLEDRATASAPPSFEQYYTIQRAIETYDPAKDTTGEERFNIMSNVLTMRSDYRSGLLSELEKKSGGRSGPVNASAKSVLGDLTQNALVAQVFGEFNPKLPKTPIATSDFNLFGMMKSAKEKDAAARAINEKAYEKSLQIKQEGEALLKRHPEWGQVEINNWFKDRLSKDAPASAAAKFLSSPESTYKPPQEVRKTLQDAKKILEGKPLSDASAPAVGGKVTSYGYKTDPWKDNASMKRVGAWNNTLDENSLAISPDIQAQFKASGIKQGDWVELELSDGSTVRRQYSDHTATDEQAKKLGLPPLRGRFDFFSPSGLHAKDGVPVVNFRKA
jgi:hypothetical protein